MERREALRNTALILGYAVSASTITAVLNGCTSDSTSSSDTTGTGVIGNSDWSAVYFNDDEIALITQMSEVILPATETPGAKDAEVYKYVDIMIGQNSDVVEQDMFREGLSAVNEECQAAYGKPFLQLDADQQYEYVSGLDKSSLDYMRENRGANYRPFFARLKELTWVGFFTSELIGENFLAYDPVPGAYHGCIPLEETGGKDWSL